MSNTEEAEDFVKSAEDFVKSELAVAKMHEYEESGSEDDYTTWELKKYVDERFNQIVVIIVVAIITLIYFLKK